MSENEKPKPPDVNNPLETPEEIARVERLKNLAYDAELEEIHESDKKGRTLPVTSPFLKRLGIDELPRSDDAE